MLLRIEFEYGAEFTQEEMDRLACLGIKYDLLKESDWSFRVNDDKDATWNKYLEYLKADKKRLDISAFVADPSFIATQFPKKRFVVKPDENPKVIGHEFSHYDTIRHYEAICNRLEASSKTFNEKCQVHIGGSMLITINKLLLLENACTDNVQSHLAAGWRIVAVTVQPDGRRPDYILGKCSDEPLPVLAERG